MGEVRDHSKEYLVFARTAVERAIAASAVEVQNEAKDLVGRNPGPTKTNPGAAASKPGEPPHLRTGTLRRSIDQETFRRGRDFVGRVGTNLKYGAFLEYGTRRMQPRPYLRPSLDAQRGRIASRLAAAFKRGR